MDDILAAMERARDEGPLAVAFDADGTLWSGDVGEDAFLGAIARHALRPAAAGALSTLAAKFGLRQTPEPNEQARILFDGYVDGLLPEVEACEMMAWGFAGWAEDELARLIADILEQANLERRRFEPLHRAVDWARERGIATVVVSASPDLVVEVATSGLGFRGQDIAACRPKRRGTTLTSELEAPLPYGEQKVRALDQLVPGCELLAAFGDNSFDLHMLRAARVGVAVRPKPALRSLMTELSGLLVLEG